MCSEPSSFTKSRVRGSLVALSQVATMYLSGTQGVAMHVKRGLLILQDAHTRGEVQHAVGLTDIYLHGREGIERRTRKRLYDHAETLCVTHPVGRSLSAREASADGICDASEKLAELYLQGLDEHIKDNYERAV